MKATVAKARRSKKKEELDQGVPKEGCHEQAEQNLVNPEERRGGGCHYP